MAVGHSDDLDPGTAMGEVIAQCRAGLGGLTPTAGLLFSALDSFDQSLIDSVHDAFPGIDVVGSTSAAEMSSVVGFLEDSVALAVFASDDVDFAAGFGNDIDRDPQGAALTAVQNALAKTVKEPRVCIVLTEGFSGQRILEALRSALPRGVLIVGGAAGRHELGGTAPTYQFCNDEIAERGVAILLLCGPVNYSTAVGTGWRVLGPHGVVTRSDYGAIHEIDGRPATEWVSAYLDLTAAGTFGNPLAVKDPGTDDWYLRVVLSGNDAGSLAIPGSVPVGATVQLTTANPDQMLAATSDAVSRARRDFPRDAVPGAALVFSCAVRKYMLGTRTAQELEAARALLPDALPIAGMYCIGEIAPTGTTPAESMPVSHFLNETFVTLLLGS